MILKMYALKDELNGFTSPIPFTNDEMAKRYLRDQFEANPTVKNTPKDFSIWRVGEYESDTGVFKGEAENVLIERAESYGSN